MINKSGIAHYLVIAILVGLLYFFFYATTSAIGKLIERCS